MRVLHINTSDYGGAANACIRLHHGLMEHGVESRLLLRSSSKSITAGSVHVPKSVVTPEPSISTKIQNKIHRLAVEFWLSRPRMSITDAVAAERQHRLSFIASRPKGLDWFSYPTSTLDITEGEAYRSADIIHLHWVADFLDWESFFFKNKKPVVWTLHDQNPFLGGQHYAERYLGMDQEGKPLPRKLTQEETWEEKRIMEHKRNALRHVSDLHLVAPSRWMHRGAKNSSLLGRFNHYCVPNHFPSHIFKPKDRMVCRDILGLPRDGRVILFVADTMDVSRKGFGFLMKAVSELANSSEKEFIFCAVGNHAEIENPLGILRLGHIQDERLMVVAYSAADLFVIPSLEDNLPNTMIESILCGTPVVGFPTGGIVDAIGEQFGNGYICDEISVAALKKTLVKFLNNPESFDRAHIAATAASKYSSDAVTSRYIDLYRSILS